MNKRKLSLIFALLAGPAIVAAEIYQTIDADGNVVFTDVPPHDNATEVTLPELNVINSPRSYGSGGEYDRSSHKKRADEKNYTQLMVTAPQDDTVIRSNEGKVSISVAISPALTPGDTLIIELDGRQINSGNATSVSLSGIDRGTHTVSTRVVNSDGQTRISGNNISFHLKKHSALH
ncbi:DUF4124 domain-containing protein [Granulosicoccaceae sp. 1_MG-2023]|nr:DUF4124 domain-containing protein [Granulosicoccaceae sp. 1_MG-2023]